MAGRRRLCFTFATGQLAACRCARGNIGYTARRRARKRCDGRGATYYTPKRDDYPKTYFRPALLAIGLACYTAEMGGLTADKRAAVQAPRLATMARVLDSHIRRRR